ncbi:OmpH family outer membrane protein [Sphingosinicella sp. BN140058]|uniref:OmpH family outer membrane protein n=1 Tax=Sphingosinicella sp. BN140058 TaxID=1892855 RepID=UPI001FB0AA08|nr:OmpH family outer membrane protein [Sphingosinicella sp. BN140058]
MKKIVLGTAAAAALSLGMSGAALAQRNNNAAGAAVLVVDTDRVMTECTACRAAQTALQGQVQQAQQFAQGLAQPLQTEGQAIEAAVRALNGKQPDAALQQRATAFQTRQNQANQQIGQREQTIRSTQAHVQQQIGTRLIPIIESIRASRRAAIAVSKSSTLANDNAIDITAEVLTQLNQQVPSVSVTPLPQQNAPAAPAGTQPAQPQPQGR